MLEMIRAALAEVAAPFADTRTCFCRVEAELADQGCRLIGAVLDEDTLAGLVSGLRSRFPETAFDITGVRVLSGESAEMLTVVTTLTGLYGGPSFLAEQVSQLLNGASLEVLMAEDRWYFGRQIDGYLGWAYRPYLAAAAGPRPTHLVCAAGSPLYREPHAERALVTRVPAGTAVAVDRVEAGWAHVVLAGGAAGWARSSGLRDLSDLPRAEAARREQIVADAPTFVGTPYMWGGCTELGIDCSGYAQLLHRLVGITIPRDADMQFCAGRPVEFPFRAGDLLFFGEPDAAGRKITHVGVSLGRWRIIHSSRSRNGVYEDDVQAVDHLRASFAGARSFVGA